MKRKFLPYVSFSILSEFIPAIGKEERHCDMRRGFKRARKKEKEVYRLSQMESEPIRIGKWTQKAIYELITTNQNLEIIFDNLILNKNGEIIYFYNETDNVKNKVTKILNKYHTNPKLDQFQIINISPGDEGIPEPITLQQGKYEFNLFAPFDCLIQQEEKIHILDIKTGQSDFDLRQGYVYLLAAQELYPDHDCVASFYNVQTGNTSDIFTASKIQLLAVNIELADIARRHQQELRTYRNNRDRFSEIYPPNPGYACKCCEFTSICPYYCF